MRAIILLIVMAAAAWQYREDILFRLGPQISSAIVKRQAPVIAHQPDMARPIFRCDGRKHCSQMTSCAEAKLFLQNCPGMKMDGDNDGIPCEGQWCN
ncbi:excalibur calcium-binding domain-containing protein [Pseudomonas capsici]|nr:excalibur calcium-binding domain-containing protein [Pseudomonas capsici]MCV4285040.1 excalibur calcium-binding domain-containing protein [Pseudomonas capsici]